MPPSSRVHFLRAFLASALGTGLSRVLGAARDIAMAGFLGAGMASDAFWIAFTVPNLLRRFVADEGLTGALIPALAKAEAEEDREAAETLASRILGALLAGNVVLVALGVLLAEPLVLSQAWSWRDEPQQLQLAVSMTRYLLPFCMMVSLVSFLEALLNSRGHFFVPKLAPGMVSAGIVGSVLLASDAQEPVWAVVAGVLVGGVVMVAIHVPVLLRRWGPVGVSLAWSPRVRAVAKELGKVVLIGLFAQVNLLVLRQLATSLPTGAVTHYWYANRVVDLAQGVVAVAIGSALLPNISASVASDDWGRFRSDLRGALRLAGFLLIPVAAGLAAFALPVASALFRHGSYTFADTEATASVVVMMVPFVLFVAGINIVKRAYFALDDRVTLLRIGGAGVLLTGVLGYLLIQPLGIAGLALALSLSTGLQLLGYLVLLQRRIDEGLQLGGLPVPFLKMAVACVPMAGVLVAARPLGDWATGPLDPVNVGVLVGATAVAAAAYFGTAHLLGVEEVGRVLARVRARLGR